MDITRRLLGRSGTFNARGIVGVDVNSIVRRLILFDTYILKSVRLQEFPLLIAEVGFGGVLQLLESPGFEIECEIVAVGQTGQTAVLESRANKGILPPLSYSLAGIQIADRRKHIHDCLQPLHQIPGLTHKQVVKLKRMIADKIVHLPEGFTAKLAAQATADVLNKQHLVKKSVEMVVRQTLKVEPPEFSVSVHAIDAEDIRVETDLMKRMDIDLPTAHKLVEGGLMGLGGLSLRFAEMEALSALSGFTDSDLPLVDEQLKFLLRISPEIKERQFRRVVEIAGFPDFAPALSEKRLNVRRLLEIRQSDECREFREC